MAPTAPPTREVVLMPRYFLHVQSSSDILEDPVGQEFDDLAAAEREAAAAACELMAEALRWGQAAKPSEEDAHQ